MLKNFSGELWQQKIFLNENNANAKVSQDQTKIVNNYLNLTQRCIFFCV
jgi:hypothetical protein